MFQNQPHDCNKWGYKEGEASDQLLECEDCNRSFDEVPRLVHHTFQAHFQMNGEICGGCQRIYYNKAMFMMHIPNIHGSRKIMNKELLTRFGPCLPWSA